MKNKKLKIFIIFLCLFTLTGCSKVLKDGKEVVKNETTGQTLTENIICKPTEPSSIKLYEKHGVNIKKLPNCKEFSPLSNYEGLWTSLFVKPLAWVIIKIGNVFNNYGVAIIVTCLIIRILLYPLTKKTAIQSEMIKKAQPELAKLEKKYANKTTVEDQNRKAQEMMLIYQKYKINPISGCLTAFIQFPLLLSFYEAINRTPAIFEDNFLGFNLGKTPWVGIKNGEYIYILLVILIILATLVSFRKTMKDQPTAAEGMNMNFMLYFMIAMISISSFSIASAVGIYWIASNLFTILQNLLVERKKAK